MENDIEIDELIENITLSVFNIGTKQINYRILKSLPTNVNSIMEETQLTKVPVNKHLNDLEKYGLVKREKGTGKVHSTELTTLFISLIENIKKHVGTNVSNMLPKMIN